MSQLPSSPRTAKAIRLAVGDHCGARVNKPTVSDVATDVKIGTIDAAFVWDATVKQYGGDLEAVPLPELADRKSIIAAAVLTLTIASYTYAVSIIPAQQGGTGIATTTVAKLAEVRSHYNLTPEQYREKCDYPMVAPNYAAARSHLAKQMGLGQQRRRHK